jgi:hypothetical protein
MLSACNSKTNNEETNSNAVSSTATETTEESSVNSGASATGTPVVANHGGSTTPNTASSSHAQSTVEDNGSDGTTNHTSVNDNSGTSTGASTNSNNVNNDSVGSGSEDTTDATGTSNNTTGNDQNHTGSTENNTTTDANTTTIALKTLTLTVNKTTLNKDTNTTLKVEATYSDNTTKDVTEQVTWLIDNKDAVQIHQHTLVAKQDKTTTLKAKLNNKTSNPLTLTITWVVDGHVLPPEPDPIENDATLLGVDSNNDGVRDDIERKVYATYPKAIQRAVMMQAFKEKQKMLADPDMVDNAKDWEKKITKYIDCTRYLYMFKNQARISRKEASLISEWQFDTKERVKFYMDYNKALSGGVYSINKPKLDDCEFNIDKVLEMDK